MATSARYFDLVREMKNPYNHRLRLVESVRERGIKPTARLFATSTLTVRKWWRRYQQLGPSGLRERSRAPHRHPLKTSVEIEQQVLALRQKLPTFGAARLKREFDLSPSHMAIQRIWREHGLLKSRKKKYQRKQDLAHIKAQWALFQQISADTKDLDDIPNYWPQAQQLGLPAIQYTARDVRSGLLFWAFAEKRSAAASAVFASRIQQHLDRYGISLRDLVWQTDSRGDFLAKVHTYQLYFNLVRLNSHKGNQSPWQIIEQLAPRSPLELCWLPPVLLDYYLNDSGGYDVPRLP